MKKILFFVLAFIGMQVYYSCSSQSGSEKGNLTGGTEMSMTIEGMTCAAGCAKTIEKTVAGLAGVTFSEVNFEEKTATFKFDESKTSEREILEAIAALNEGQYKPVAVKTVKQENETGAPEVEAIEEALVNDTAV